MPRLIENPLHQQIGDISTAFANRYQRYMIHRATLIRKLNAASRSQANIVPSAAFDLLVWIAAHQDAEDANMQHA